MIDTRDTDPRDPDSEASADRIGALEAEVAALRADNARLRRLLDAEGAPDSLRHAFRDTAALLRAVMRRTAESAADVADYDAHLAGRLDAIVRARALTDAFGEAGVHTLVADALSAYLVREGEQAALDGPDVRLRPKAAQAFALAMHELATNAVEHGPLGGPAGLVAVSWRVEAGAGAGAGAPMLALDWAETGAAEPPAPARRGFGTAMLEEMLAYEFGGRARLSYAPGGLRCELRLPLTPRIGHLAEGDLAGAP